MHHNSRSKIWAIGIFSLLIICTTCVGVVRLSRTRSALIEPNAEALKAYALGDWATSARLANARLRSNQEDVEAVRILARSSARQGRDDLATTLYENRLGLQSMQSEDHFLLGRMIATQGNTDLALGVWEKALKEDSSHPEMLESFAGMSAQKSHLEEAVAAASKLANIPGLEAKGLLMQGIFKSLMEDYQGSTKSISQAFLIDPKIKSSFMTDDQQMRLFLKDLLRNGQPGEARIRQIGLRHLRQHIAGTRAGNDQGAEICGHILHGNRAVGGKALAQQIHIVRGSNGGADDVEMVFTQARDGELAPQLSIICERIG